MYVSACPLDWIKGDSCVWPARTGLERKAISNNMKPESDWLHIENIKILGRFCTYKDALNYEKKKSLTSDTESEFDNRKRKIKKNKKYRDDSVSPPPSAIEGTDESSVSISEISSDEELDAKTKCTLKKEKAKQIYNKSIDSSAISSPPQKELCETNTQQDSDNENFKMSSSASSSKNFTDNSKMSSLSASAKNFSDNDSTLVQFVNNADIVFVEKTFDDLWNLVTDVKEQLLVISERLDIIEKMVATSGGITKRTGVELPKLPLQSLLELEELERDLQNTSLEECLLNYLQFIGGNETRMCIFRVLEKVFSNYLAQFCSWTGKGGNFKLSSLKLMDIIKKAVKVSFPSMTERAFENCIRAWFNHGKTRHNREQQRSVT